MIEALSNEFFQRALAAGLLASVACGIVGSLVVVRRMASMSGGLAHAAFGGVGLGYLLGFDPMLGAAGFALIAALLLGVAYFRLSSAIDTLVAMVWSVGMALGILFVSLKPGYAPDLTSFLFGSIVLVPPDYVRLIAILDVVILVVVVALFKEFQAVAFDENFAQVMGVRVQPVFLLMLALSSLAIVTLIRIVGIILVIALLTIPAAIARQWSDQLPRMMIIASLAGALLTTAGLFTTYAVSVSSDLTLPTGPLIILLAVAAYALSTLVRRAV